MEAPVVVKAVPDQVGNEQAAFGPIDLNEFIKTPGDDPKPTFRGELKDGSVLPAGVLCTGDGVFTAIPPKGTKGTYEIVITASNDAGSIRTNFNFTIKPALSDDGHLEAPFIVKAIPDQVVNEQAAFGPIDLNEFIKMPGDDPQSAFTGELKDGSALPRGVLCTPDGMFTAIPSKGTEGTYEVVITASNEAGSIKANFNFRIKPSLSQTAANQLDKVKAQVWEALEKRLPLPDLGDLYDRPITSLDIYYLLERWGVLKIWDAFNLDLPGENKMLNLQGASQHYHVYDRGSCLVAVPKDLFSYERTVEDGLKTAKAMAREVYTRNWTVELVGFDKFTRAAWIELQHLGDKNGKFLEIINYEPSPNDLKLYHTQAERRYDLGME